MSRRDVGRQDSHPGARSVPGGKEDLEVSARQKAATLLRSLRCSRAQGRLQSGGIAVGSTASQPRGSESNGSREDSHDGVEIARSLPFKAAVKNQLPPEPFVVYHGTTRRLWKKQVAAPSRICFTRDRSDAEQYAYEFAASHDQGLLRVKPEPLLLAVPFSSLRGLKMLPDDAAEASAQRKLTWRQSLKHGGTFCAFGDVEGLKKRVKVRRLPVQK